MYSKFQITGNSAKYFWGYLISSRMQIWETKKRDLPWKQKPVDNLTAISAQDIPQNE
jgi:hypothetical protein